VFVRVEKKMDKGSKVVLAFFVVACLVLVSTFVAMFMVDSSDVEAVDDTDYVELDDEGFLYRVSWSIESGVIGYDEIKSGMNRSRLFRDGSLFNGLFDGSLSFCYDFGFDEKFLKTVNVSVSWNDRYVKFFGLTGDRLDVSLVSPLGEECGRIRGVKFGSKFLYDRVLKDRNPTVFCSSVVLNDCPPDFELVANGSDEALECYWDMYDVFDFTKGFDGDWCVRGESYTKELRPSRRVRNLFRNFLLGLLSDPLSIEISYSYCVFDVERVDTFI
jgi:hypothetical protein